MSKKRERMKDIGWEKILNHLDKEHHTLNNLVITSKEIKKITREEPRIICRFDDYETFPEPLKKRNLFVLPVKNGYYQILEGIGLHTIDPLPEVEVEEYISKLKFELISSTHGSGESKYLDIAINSGLVEHFVKSSPLFLTIRGRKYSPYFRFKFHDSIVEVKGVQVEVDAGFEGNDIIVLIEAKGEKPSSFNIRQLYYPYRFWSTEIENKIIINIFFWYNKKDDTYHFCQYDFKDETDYHSIELERYQIYRIKQLVLEDAKDLTSQMIPQADDMVKIIKLVEEVSKGHSDSHKIAERLQFTTRQSSYYRQAAEILQLVSIDKNKEYHLTETGLKLIKTTDKEMNIIIHEQILKIPIVHKIISDLLEKKDKSTTLGELIPFVMKQTGLSENTARRRLKTLFSWFKWSEEKIGSFVVTKNKLSLKADKFKTLIDFL